jgi:hypothetical protein
MIMIIGGMCGGMAGESRLMIEATECPPSCPIMYSEALGGSLTTLDTYLLLQIPRHLLPFCASAEIRVINVTVPLQ